MIQKIKGNLKQMLVPKSKLVILNYHQLGEKFDSKIHNEFIWNNLELFREHMHYLMANYEIVALKDGVEALRNNTINNTRVCITFDDGDASMTRCAMPILEELNIPATFFINTAYGVEKMGYWYNLGPYFGNQDLIKVADTIRNTDNKATYRNLLKLEDRVNNNEQATGSPFYADYKEFEKCTNPLFHFGLHGHEHFRFSMLSKDEQRLNLYKNIEAMKHWPNYVPYFAIPFGKPHDWNKFTLEVADELGVVPLLAHHGYNTIFNTPLLRFSVDTKNLKTVFAGFSPFQKSYYKLNKLNY